MIAFTLQNSVLVTPS